MIKSGRLHIAILESSKIICEGIQTVLYQSDMDCRVHRLDALDDLTELLDNQPIDILIANPVQFVNREKEIQKIRRRYPSMAIAGIDFGMMHKPSTSLLPFTTQPNILYNYSRNSIRRVNPSPTKKEVKKTSPKERSKC